MIKVVTSAFCHDGTSRFVVLKRGNSCRDEQGRWDLISGQIELGLTAVQNVAKEVREEIGANPLSLSFLGYRDVFRGTQDSPDAHVVAFDFAVHVDPGRTYNAEPYRHDELRWVTLEDVSELSPVHSQLAKFMSKYRSQLRGIFERKS